jgi:hypothetical protein
VDTSFKKVFSSHTGGSSQQTRGSGQRLKLFGAKKRVSTPNYLSSYYKSSTQKPKLP